VALSQAFIILTPIDTATTITTGLDVEQYAAVLGRVQALRCAPALRAPLAAWTRPARGKFWLLTSTAGLRHPTRRHSIVNSVRTESTFWHNIDASDRASA
jgi:hypothetical protein